MANLDDRGRYRNRRAAVSGGMSMLAKAIQVATSLVTVPLTLHYLGNERFGLWMTISSVLAMAAFADFGIGNGVLNTVATAFGQDDIIGMRRAVSSGFVVLSSIAAIILCLFLAVYPFVPWANVFRVTSPQAMVEAGPALMVFATCFALNIALDVVQRVQLGIQESYRFGMWQMGGSVVGLLGVLGGIRLHVALPWLIMAIAGGPVLATAANAITFFGWIRRDLRPALDLVSREMIRNIVRLGMLFFVLQVVVSFAYSADNFILARTLGAVHVPDYAIPQRMFALISMTSAMLLTPLWPAYGEAISRGDFKWVRRTLSRTLKLVLAGSSIGALTLLLLAHRLLGWWVGTKSVHPPLALLTGLAVWTVFDACGNALAMFLNGSSMLRFQIVTASTFGLLCVMAKVLLVSRFGVAALPWSTIVSYTLCAVIPYSIHVPRTLRRLQERSPRIVATMETGLFSLAALKAGEEQ